MITKRAYKYRIYPDKEQRDFFARTFGCVRLFYNTSLDEMNKLYKEKKEYKDITPASYKERFPFFKEVDSLALANAQLNRNKALKSFFKKQNKFPKFKAKRNKQSYSTNNQNGTVYLSEDGKYISLPKIKNIKIKMHRKFDGVIKTVTVSKECDETYYVSILVEENIEAKPKSKNSVGIDLGIKSYIVDSNAERIDNPKHLSRSLLKLAIEQRKLSHMKKGGKNRNKQRIKVARLHRRIRNQRNDFLQKLSSKYINENQVIVLEDLNIKQMEQDSRLSRLIVDASWSKFVSLLEYKGNWYGRDIIKVPTYYPSSQLCSCCGYQNKEIKDLSIREWVCPKCGATHSRDHNASINILNKGLDILKARTLPDSSSILDSEESLSEKRPLL
ncbi:MAG: IS200/IS605 family element RNA-guided endonuclease TnpB [Bacilli bacterium]|nr:IS200/IS605 family element RNA-guided endonuclease TnpB [Bacilli bacterium]